MIARKRENFDLTNDIENIIYFNKQFLIIFLSFCAVIFFRILFQEIEGNYNCHILLY